MPQELQRSLGRKEGLETHENTLEAARELTRVAEPGWLQISAQKRWRDCNADDYVAGYARGCTKGNALCKKQLIAEQEVAASICPYALKWSRRSRPWI